MRKWREHNCIHRKRLAAALACMLALLCLCPSALAIDRIDEQALCTLTVNFRPGGENGDGAQIRLYRVADMTGFGDFTPVYDFAGLGEPVNGLEDEEWNVLARKMASYVDHSSLTNRWWAKGTVTGGKVVFKDLPVGLYLLVYDVYSRSSIYYLTDPMLISLPNHSDPNDPDAWMCEVEISPKAHQIQAAPLRVRKEWVRAPMEEWKPVTIHLMVKGKIAETVVLSAANNWCANFSTKLQNGDWWSVAEATKLEGFKNYKWDWSWDGKYVNIYVTNEKKPPVTPSTTGPAPTPKPNYPPVLPQTGLLWWPVPVLAVGGMLLFGLGWARRRRHD